jgi:hypothetical protein
MLQVFRHGQRTPADTYPKDPYINYTFESVGWGQLTNVSLCLLLYFLSCSMRKNLLAFCS